MPISIVAALCAVTGGQPTRRGRRRPGLRRTRASVGLLVLVLALSGCASVGAATRATGTPSAVQVDVIGDSLSTGYKTPGDPWTSNAQQLFDAQGQKVTITNAAENGAGYLAVGDQGDLFVDEVNNIVTAQSQIVLVFGSDNDLGQSDVAAAITATLQRIRSLAPQARLVVIGPPAPPADQPQQLESIRDALRVATRQAGGQFVDPLSLKWFQGDAAANVGPDSEHPNLSGEQYLAEQMTGVLTPVIDNINSV